MCRQPAPEKSQSDITSEIQAIIRQVLMLVSLGSLVVLSVCPSTTLLRPSKTSVF